MSKRPSLLTERLGFLRRLEFILDHEGVLGLYDRLRYPKPFWRMSAWPAGIRGPILIRGGGQDDRRQIARALQDCGIAVADKEATTAIHLAPAWPVPARVTKDDILVDTGSEDPAGLEILARGCRVLLTVCPSRIDALTRKGIPLEKLFLLKDGARLYEGLTRCLWALQHIGPGRASWRYFLDLQDLSEHPRICLGLPETVRRRQKFLAKGLEGFVIFDGIRRKPGWIGAAESFRMMAQACLDQDVLDALFIEDDVELPGELEERLVDIRSYLSSCSWDVFSGLITDIGPGYAVKKVVRRKDLTFVHLNRCVGMVFGLYSRNALSRLTTWDEASGLTIDRHLERSTELEVVTTLPFLAGHDDRLTSSIWHFRNRRYNRLIKGSENRLRRMVEAHEVGIVTKP